jgi:sulfotransferase family protein
VSLARISRVSVDSPPPDRLHGSYIDAPVAGMESEVYSFCVEGWALGSAAPVERIEVLQEGRVIADGPLEVERPDIQELFQGIQGARSSGFRVPVNLLDVRSDFKLLIRARLRSGLFCRLGFVFGIRETISSGYEPTFRPLMMATIGRSGSTWLTWLLSRHPSIYAFKPFEHETRVATYWMAALQRLTQPRSYLTQIDPPDLATPGWWLGASGFDVGVLRDPDISRWLGRESVNQLVAVAQSRIDAFYRQACPNAETGTYFVEKVSPWQTAADVLAEAYQGARELILVRDFRDMFCSIRAFNLKRGSPGFGRDLAESDAEYIRQIVAGFARALLKRWRDRRSDAHVVRYEDLVLSPGETLRDTLGYLGLDSSPDVVAETLHRAEYAEGAQQHQTASNPAASIGRWQHELSDELKAACEATLAPVLEEFGYAPSWDPGVHEAQAGPA